VTAPSTRDALLEQGALLFARHGVAGVSAKQLHEAAGARNESALHYHFGDRRGLVAAILRDHVAAVESRRRSLVDGLRAEGRQSDLRAVVHALAAPMADDLATPLGRAHLRIVAQLDQPSLGHASPFEGTEASLGASTPAGETAVGLLRAALPEMPPAVRVERLAALRALLIALVGRRAQLVDDDAELDDPRLTSVFLENLVDMAVALLTGPVSPATTAAVAEVPPRGKI
jgi:AcrR family transcriptional regulator